MLRSKIYFCKIGTDSTFPKAETVSYILALDQGTTSSRAIVFEQAGAIVAVAQTEFPQIFPKPGWVEHDPRDIWSTQLGGSAEALQQAHIPARAGPATGARNQTPNRLHRAL
mgnify:CR=1 FL=1